MRLLGALRRCDRVGAGSVVSGSPYIENRGHIVIGRGFHFSATPAASHLVTGAHGVIEIGDDVSIGHGAAIAAEKRIAIGSGARIAPFVMIMDTDFHVVGDRHGTADARPVAIADEVQIGSRVTILRGSTIGARARVAPGSVVVGDVPADADVAGVPARLTAAAVAGEAPVSMARIAELVARAVGLAEPPGESARPEDLLGWTSLSALNVLLSLEEAFDVALSPEDVLQAQRVGDLLRLVGEARGRAIAR
ncbi:MAG TPA: phosphopantetheine-binding protein [Gemmatimonadaceae bacterium]|nr:phosphopantetheine-binding protein [Gemmatimonadaceae bacterium]